MRPEITTALPTSQNWDYLTFNCGYYLVPSITCHHCLIYTWYDNSLPYTSPKTYNKESPTHLRQHAALVLCETELRPHTNATAAATPSKPPQVNHSSSNTQQQHISRDSSSRGGGDQTSPATTYVRARFSKIKANGTRPTNNSKLPLSKNQKS